MADYNSYVFRSKYDPTCLGYRSPEERDFVQNRVKIVASKSGYDVLVDGRWQDGFLTERSARESIRRIARESAE